ncbi:MAG TPA: M24 family metallopeptidase, partial [Burkholderiales bacterium]|nr:M24 family metallopeptidase [Burkholderiales bacterium]
GASNTVLLIQETGIAEILVNAQNAWVLCDHIEAQRLVDEALPSGFELHVSPWMEPDRRETFVREHSENRKVLSDRAAGQNEAALPPALVTERYVLSETEQHRFRRIGRLAAEAMGEVLQAAKPEWTEYQLAGAGAEALWQRGLHPALTLAAGSRRLPLYRHPTPTGEKLGSTAMLVFCARGDGLIANLTRFVRFEQATAQENTRHQQIRDIEGAALDRCKSGIVLAEVYQTLSSAYRAHGYPDALLQHHQGGLAGYLAREALLMPQSQTALRAGMAIALNPSLPGAKIEDTFILEPSGALTNLTLDDSWPSETVRGRKRPLPMERW